MKVLKIERQNLSENVYNQILDNIQNGTWKEGDKLPSESTLCKLFNVSRVSIRSALQALRTQNYIVTNQGMGSFITNPRSKPTAGIESNLMDLSRDEFVEIQEFRQAIEFQATELAAIKATEEDFVIIADSLEKMIKNKENCEAYTEADYEFHLNIVKSSKNKLLYNIMKEYKSIFISFLSGMHHSNESREFSIENHQNILTTLRERNSKKVKALMQRSIKYNIARYSDNFRN